MKIIVHYPDTEEGKKELSHRLALLHAKIVLDFIRSLPCSPEQKLLLIDQIKAALPSDAVMRG